MKKLEKAFGLALALAASAAFFACKTEEPEPKQIPALEVKVAAYPGANYVDWPSVPDAVKYKVFRKDEKGRRKLLDVIDEKASDYMDADGALQDKMKYAYEVIGVNKDGDTCTNGAAEVTANIPQANTPALDLANSGVAEEAKLSGKTILVQQKDGESLVTVMFPAKPFLKYTVIAEPESDSVPYSADGKIVESFARKTVGDGVGSVTLMLEQSGAYSIKVRVESYSKAYVPSDIVAEQKAYVKKLNAGQTGEIVSAAYTDGKTIRIEWKPALIGGNEVAVSMYKVFRLDAAGKKDPVTAEIKTKKNSDDETIYYVFDKSANPAVTNTYEVVMNDGKGRTATLTKSVLAYKNILRGADVAENVSAAYTDSKTIRIIWVPAKVDGKEAKKEMYKVYRTPSSSGGDPAPESQLFDLAADGKDIKEGKITDGKTLCYYADIKPADTSVTNYYAVVLDGKTYYGATATADVSKYEENDLRKVWGSITASLKCLDKDALTNDLIVKVTYETGASVAVSYAKRLKSDSNEGLTDADYKPITPLKDSETGKKIGSVKDLAEGAYVVRVVLTKAGRKDMILFKDEDENDRKLTVRKASEVSFGRAAEFTVYPQGEKIRITLKDDYEKVAKSYYTYAVHYAEAMEDSVSGELVATGAWQPITPVVMERTAVDKLTSVTDVDAKKFTSQYIFRATKSHESATDVRYASLDMRTKRPTTRISAYTTSLGGTVIAEWDRSEDRFTKWEKPAKSVLKFTARPNYGALTTDDKAKVAVYLAELVEIPYEQEGARNINGKYYKLKDDFKKVTGASIVQDPASTPTDPSDDSFICTVEVPTFLGAYEYFVTYDINGNGDPLFSEKKILRPGNEDGLQKRLDDKANYRWSSSAEPEKTYEHLRASNSYHSDTEWTDNTVKLTIK